MQYCLLPFYVPLYTNYAKVALLKDVQLQSLFRRCMYTYSIILQTETVSKWPCGTLSKVRHLIISLACSHGNYCKWKQQSFKEQCLITQRNTIIDTKQLTAKGPLCPRNLENITNSPNYAFLSLQHQMRVDTSSPQMP